MPSPRVSPGTYCWNSWTRAAGTSPSSTYDAPRDSWVFGTARSRTSSGASAPNASAGASRRKRWIGSQTTVPACSSARIRTSGVSLRKSPAVLLGET